MAGVEQKGPEQAPRVARESAAGRAPSPLPVGARGFLRYLLVGGLLFLLDTTVFVAQVKMLGVDVRLAQLVSRTVGASTGFFAHRAVTFPSEERDRAWSVATQGTGYVAVTLLNIGISPFVVQATVHAVPSSLLLAKVLAEAIVVTETFLLLKLVFRQKERP